MCGAGACLCITTFAPVSSAEIPYAGAMVCVCMRVDHHLQREPMIYEDAEVAVDALLDRVNQKSKSGCARAEQDSARAIGGPFHPICRRCVNASAGWKLLHDRARCFGSIPKSD